MEIFNSLPLLETVVIGAPSLIVIVLLVILIVLLVGGRRW